eukprot:8854555-Heterocapsa_arctica.AAC.1
MEEYTDISVKTKAAIMESILGLGYIYAERITKSYRICRTSSTSWKRSEELPAQGLQAQKERTTPLYRRELGGLRGHWGREA